MGGNGFSLTTRREFLARGSRAVAGLGVLGTLPAFLSGCGTGDTGAEKGPGEEFTGALTALANTPEESKIAGKNGFAPNPAIQTSASVDGSEFFAVPTFAENDDEAWRFIELVSSREGQRIAAEGGWAPMYAELLEDEELLEQCGGTQTLYGMQRTRLPPPGPLRRAA